MARTRSDIGPRIVDAARARFLAEGVDGASLRAIAEAAGTSIGMVYYYFRTKDDLFFAVVEETYQRLLDDLRRACDPALPPIERMRGLYRRIGAIDERESQIVRLVMREVLVSSKRLDRLIARFARGHFPLVIATIADGMRSGAIRADLSPLILLPIAIAVGAIPQFLLRHIAPGLPGPRGDALADALVELLWHGIAARPAGAAASARSRMRRRTGSARRAR
jgi:AcrR family transcriptional regulator